MATKFGVVHLDPDGNEKDSWVIDSLLEDEISLVQLSDQIFYFGNVFLGHGHTIKIEEK